MMDDPTARIFNWIPIVISIVLLIAGEIYGGDVAYIASVLCAVLLLYYGSVYVRESQGRTRHLMNISYIIGVFALIVGCGCVFVSMMNLGDFPYRDCEGHSGNRQPPLRGRHVLVSGVKTA